MKTEWNSKGDLMSVTCVRLAKENCFQLSHIVEKEAEGQRGGRWIRLLYRALDYCI